VKEKIDKMLTSRYRCV